MKPIKRQGCPESVPSIGDRVTGMQLQRGWLQQDWAELASVGTTTLHMVENRKRLPNFETLCQVAIGLGANVEWLAFGLGQ